MVKLSRQVPEGRRVGDSGWGWGGVGQDGCSQKNEKKDLRTAERKNGKGKNEVGWSNWVQSNVRSNAWRRMCVPVHYQAHTNAHLLV